MQPWTHRILVVDDDPTTRMMLHDSLELMGYLVDAVPGVDEARFALGTGSYAAVVIDVNLPDGSGMDLIKTARITQVHGARVVVVTGHTEDVFRRRAEALGADAFVAKPFAPDQILDACELRAQTNY